KIFDHPSGISHHSGIAAEELSGDGVLVFLEIQIAKRFGGAARDALGAGELRHEQTAAAQAADDAAEKRVRHPGHGREDRGGRDRQIADFVTGGNHWLSPGRRKISYTKLRTPRRLPSTWRALHLVASRPKTPLRSFGNIALRPRASRRHLFINTCTK